ncbi:MAG TPA: 3-oxoacyl-[acyl-carrier-protein] synthase III C-terminal domain-containing protein [Bacillota bacterium]|jgi:hydroxymethylglutaryl-CoA synthase|nr:3-oxoacyl-[acyl-carrier-protein] synthase III C-terminal domain-containing protein [Bacillota bacterium]HPZ12585.1 3-oxoacyl-[acyl-carrier-protein] synthase III C-terminal domain-containing protein [Bacillota bacterium]HQE10981.1 3-oxoacyl-[acyl-carrier-protein] synthase III C-terminal domain-containing protein [Bacillota bacterium]
MIGIISYAAYLPRYRLNRMNIFSAMGWLNPALIMNAAGEKAVAGYDEDAVTMAAAAGKRCLQRFNPAELGALYLATTTAPYKERQCANIVAGALCAPEGIRSADFTGALKAGTSALLAALELSAVNGGKQALVCAADCRLGKMGSLQEMIFGDGAAALLVGGDKPIALFKGSYSLSYDFVDQYRGAGTVYNRQWEERWVRDMGFEQFIPEAVTGLCHRCDLKPSDFAKVIYPCYFGAARRNINKKLGLDPAQVEDDLLQESGDTGTAHPLLMLTKALEEASPGDKLLLVSYGSGCDALYFEVTPEIEKFNHRKRFSDTLAQRTELDNYTKYLTWRRITPVELGLRGEEEQVTRWSMAWRSRKAILGLQGSRCKQCGTQQYPPQRVCVNPDCGVIDDMEPVNLSEKGGKIVSYTSDMLAATINPPAIYGNVDFNGGGRAMFEFADCTLDDLQVGKPVEFTFRIKYYDPKRDITFYFWKAVPVAKEVS